MFICCLPKTPCLAASTDVPAHVKAYDAALSDVTERWSALSKEIGGDQDKVMQVFSCLRNFLWTAAGRAEPSTEEIQKLVAPVANLLTEISAFKESQRKSPLYNHLCAVSEGIPAVGWVLVKKTPAPHVKDMLEASMFYINRIFKDYKDSDKKHVEWARTWKELLETMHEFVRQTHTTGLVWNSAPGSSPPAEDRAAIGDHSSAPGAPVPPPPPPPPPYIQKFVGHGVECILEAYVRILFFLFPLKT
ncbi:CAP protein [Oesophagostomum dentatum]|uniref:CAP protein n=1 Tax=Oesophagostomum dentatum TaxID=61180 RepID=A0A0B1TA40_OESDE|nr:CAP protein [Oesophagostomum dentatum]